MNCNACDLFGISDTCKPYQFAPESIADELEALRRQEAEHAVIDPRLELGEAHYRVTPLTAILLGLGLREE